MSGHSKWATIHRQKGVKDAKRGAIFTKLAGAISIAVKSGGGIGDINQNFRLRLAVDRAKQFNMPKDNIQRAIDKGLGTGGGEQPVEAVFEGFLPGGAAGVETLTNNKLRTSQQIRTTLDKGGGSLGSSGAVGYLFDHKGMISCRWADRTPKTHEAQELELIDLGALEIEEDGEGGYLIFCDRDKTYNVKEKLTSSGYVVNSAELVMKPESPVELPPDSRLKAEKLAEQLAELDDVTNVWTNYA